MTSIDEYIDAAKVAQNFKSDRQLCAALDLSSAAVNHWRTGRTWPSDETIIALADLGGRDKQRALIDLNIWRAGRGVARDYYTAIARAMRATAAGLAILAGAAALAPDVNAARTGAAIDAPMYIMENRVQGLRRRFARGIFELGDWIFGLWRFSLAHL